VIENDQGVKVTVLVASRCRESLLPGCLTSLLSQTLQAIEVLLIHGPGGNDLEAARPFLQDPRIRCLPSRRPGLYAAWNTGIEHARGRYFATLNTDDRLRPDALERMVAALDAHPEVCLVYGDSLITTRPDETFAHNSSGGRRLAPPPYSHRALLAGCLCGPHPMWRRSVHAWAGAFDESFVSAADYDFWLRLAACSPMLHLAELLGLYYENPQGLSRADPLGARAERVRVMKRHLDCYRDLMQAAAVPLEPLA
jgi:glycosyltransferase involved in cell wall biosynthesis